MEDDSSTDKITMAPEECTSSVPGVMVQNRGLAGRKDTTVAQRMKLYPQRKKELAGRKLNKSNDTSSKALTSSERSRLHRQRKKRLQENPPVATILYESLEPTINLDDDVNTVEINTTVTQGDGTSVNQDSCTTSTSDLLMAFESAPLLVTDRPLMQFLKRLIFNKNSQNTMLTNAQLEDILSKEFDFNLMSLHPLEVDIFVTVLKKYLKEWPMWDEFEATTKGLADKFETNTFVNVLEKRYNNLKSYLKANLDMAKELSSDVVAKVKSKQKELKTVTADERKGADSSGVVLEIQSTRDQLNKLIYRQPHAGFNCTIFNVEDKVPPSQIKMNRLSLDAILNWWSVRVTISLQSNGAFLTRETSHELQHSLVNRRRRKEPQPSVLLNEEIQIRDPKKVKQLARKQIVGCLNLLSAGHDSSMEGMQTIIECVKRDLCGMETMAAPAQYRRYLNKHPYVRYLYSEAETVKGSDQENYDIQLMETVSPMCQFSIGRMEITEDRLPQQWLKVECVSCNVTCSGEDLATQLRLHFDGYHDMEPDWHCTNCQMSIPMAQLAEMRWKHDCEGAK